MDLHRTTGKPDWETIPEEKRTAIQKLAAATHGVITPPNIISLIGFGLVVYGLVAVLREEYWLGLCAILFGRLLDIVDGIVAQKTGTKSALGELVDATIDKIGTLLTIIVLYAGGISYWWLITALLVPQVCITAMTLYKRLHGQNLHPSLAGKLSMALLWVSIGGLILIKALELAPSHLVSIGIYGVVAVSVGLGMYAFWLYVAGRD